MDEPEAEPEVDLVLALERAHDTEAQLEPHYETADGTPCSESWSVKAGPVGRVEASSALAEGSIVHDAARAVDGDPSTAWVEGVSGDGTGESLVVWLDEQGKPPAMIGILPGYARDARRWRSNHRVRTLLVRWLVPREDGAVGPFARSELRYKGWSQLRVALHHEGVVPERAWQYVTIGGSGGLFLHDMTIGDTVAVELSILEAESEGAEHDDTCISEIQLLEPDRYLGARCPRIWCEQEGITTGGCAEHGL